MTSSSDSSNQHPLPDTIDTSKPQSARFWNYLLGGKDNYLVDREAGDEILALIPTLVDSQCQGDDVVRGAVLASW